MVKISVGAEVQVCGVHDQPPGVLFRKGRGSQGFVVDFRLWLFEARPTFRIFASLWKQIINYLSNFIFAGQAYLRRPDQATMSARLEERPVMA